nr:Uncharacterised protein [Raoultella sp. NCTC 9187]
MSHLMLSCHGIWFYRKVYLTPRKRRKIRISLLTRSRREALLRVEKYLTSQPFHCVPQSIPAHTATPSASFQQPQQKKPFKSLKSELDKYTSAKTGEVGEREILTINRCVNAILIPLKSLSARGVQRYLLMVWKVQHPPETVTIKEFGLL